MAAPGSVVAPLVGGALALVVGLVAVAALDDPEEAVPATSLTVVGREGPMAGAPAIGAGQLVPALEQLTGTVRRDGDDVDQLSIGGVALEFGPGGWVASAGALGDYDRDGRAEPFAAELEGLVGTTAEVRGRLDDDGEDAAVYAINGLTYRDVGAPAPWHAEGAVGDQAIRAAAVAAVGPGTRVLELESEDGTSVAWEADVIDASGREFEVLLDATGRIVDILPE